MSLSRDKALYPVFGVLAEFENSDDLIEAIEQAKERGYSKMEAYTPLPIHEVIHAIGHKNRLPLLVLIGGIVGALVGFGMQYYASVIHYPVNIGGRPLNSWPAFIVITFETTILFAALTCVLGMLALNGLPQPYHPVFNLPMFETASRNRFFLLLLARDPVFDREGAADLLGKAKSLAVEEVPH
jgi:hypothetical protein